MSASGVWGFHPCLVPILGSSGGCLGFLAFSLLPFVFVTLPLFYVTFVLVVTMFATVPTGDGTPEMILLGHCFPIFSVLLSGHLQHTTTPMVAVRGMTGSSLVIDRLTAEERGCTCFRSNLIHGTHVTPPFTTTLVGFSGIFRPFPFASTTRCWTWRWSAAGALPTDPHPVCGHVQPPGPPGVAAPRRGRAPGRRGGTVANAPQPVRRGRPLVPTPTPPPTTGGPGTPPAKPVPHAPGAPRRAGPPAASPARPLAGAGPGGAAAGPPAQHRHHGTTKGTRQRRWCRTGRHELRSGGLDGSLQAPRPRYHGAWQYRPTDCTALASAVAAVKMGPVAAWLAQLLPHVPCRDTQPRRPAATHPPTAPLTAEQLYIVAAALLADGGESFVHHHGPAQIAGSIQGPQRDAPDPWYATLRGRTRVWDAGNGTPPPAPQQGEALVLQTAGYQAILHGHAGGYRSNVLAGDRWTVWHSTARQGAFPPLPHVDWQQGPTQAYYMSAHPWPLAVLLHTVSAPNKRQEPGWVNPPALVWSPDQEEHLQAAWQGDAIRATDVPDLRAGPITHARPAATLAVAQRGQQKPQWVVCMFSPADAHIVVWDPERLPGP